MCPYDKNLFDLNQFEKGDIEYINEYHKTVLRNVSPILEQQNNQLALDWLKKQKLPL